MSFSFSKRKTPNKSPRNVATRAPSLAPSTAAEREEEKVDKETPTITTTDVDALKKQKKKKKKVQKPKEVIPAFHADTSLLLYRSDVLTVQETRQLHLSSSSSPHDEKEEDKKKEEKEGNAFWVDIGDLPQTFQPASLFFLSETDPSAHLMEHRLVGAENFVEGLQALKGRKVVVQPLAGEAEGGGPLVGTLLNVLSDNSFVLQNEDGEKITLGRTARAVVYAADGQGEATDKEEMQRSALVGSLQTVLRGKVHTRQEGQHTVKLLYSASGCTWTANYTVLVHPNQKQVQINAWWAIDNTSGKSFRNAAIALIADELTNEPDENDALTLNNNNSSSLSSAKRMTNSKISNFSSGLSKRNNGRKFRPRSAIKATKYYLDHPVSLPDGQTTHVNMLHGQFDVQIINLYRGCPFRKYTVLNCLHHVQYRGCPFRKYTVYNPDKYCAELRDITKIIKFQNDSSVHSSLGRPLPIGHVDIYQQSSTFLSHLHSTSMPRTAAGERVDLPLSPALKHLHGSRRQSEFKVDEKKRTLTERITIQITNASLAKEEEVVVEEVFYRWEEFVLEGVSPEPTVLEESDHFASWKIKVGPSSHQVIVYTVTYTNLPQPGSAASSSSAFSC